jgi:hypothetical protein
MRQLKSTRARALAALVLASALALTGCTGGGKSHPAATTPTAKPSQIPQAPSKPVKDGHFTFTLLSLECGIAGVTGTHSEATPDGQFCTAILRIHNDDQDFHAYVTKEQRLEGVAEPRNRPDAFAMGVRRQNPDEKVGGSDLMEVELWFDVPKDAVVTGLRVQGDRDAAGFLDSTPVAHAPDGVFIAMTPKRS